MTTVDLESVAPGPSPTRRTLHFILVADCSGSMSGDKIQSLNYAVRTAIPEMRAAAAENPQVDVMVRALRFSSSATWHIGTPTPVDQFEWRDLDADSDTRMGQALRLVAQELNPQNMPGRVLPPVLILLTDGQPTDDFAGGLKAVLDAPYGKKAVRIGIAIGSDADKDKLQQFIGNPEFKPLEAHNATELVQQIRWVSTTLLKTVSKVAPNPQGPAVPTPPPPDPNAGPIEW